MNDALSVIVPIGLKDESWKSLIPDLLQLSSRDELVFSIVEDIAADLRQSVKWHHLSCSVKIVQCIKGRARQMNQAAKTCRNSFYWFLHCDSRLEPGTVALIKQTIAKEWPMQAIWYCDLKFARPRTSLMRLTELGVWVRSHILRLPFGDQGFVMGRVTFECLEGYSELAEFGEDHLMIWKAHEERIAVLPLKCSVLTSARKYQTQGWCSVTFRHLKLTVTQAVPELLKILWGRRL